MNFFGFQSVYIFKKLENTQAQFEIVSSFTFLDKKVVSCYTGRLYFHGIKNADDWEVEKLIIENGSLWKILFLIKILGNIF